MGDFYHTKRWAAFSAAMKKQAGYRCLRCDRTEIELNVGGLRLHTHHIKRVDRYPSLGFVPSNCEVLCEECHDDEHAAGRIYAASKIERRLKLIDAMALAEPQARQQRRINRQLLRLFKFAFDRQRAEAESIEAREHEQRKAQEGVLDAPLNTEGGADERSETETPGPSRGRSS